MSIDAAGTVFIVYPSNHTVVAVSSSGAVTATFRGFTNPTSVFAFATNMAYVTDSAYGTLWSLDATTGVASLVASGLAVMAGPDAGVSSVAVGGNGTIYVLESKATGSRILAFATPSSTPTVVITAGTGTGTGIGASPRVLAVNGSASLVTAGIPDAILLGIASGAVLSISTDGSATVSTWYTVPGSSAITQLSADCTSGYAAILNAAGAGRVLSISNNVPASSQSFAVPAGTNVAGMTLDPVTGKLVVSDSSSRTIVAGLACSSPSFGTGFLQPCATCSAGSQANADGTCTACAAGTFSADGKVCTACPLATYASSTSATSCSACPAGTITASAGSPSLASCVACPAGTYSNSGDTVCTPAPAGSFTGMPGSASSSIEQCPAGYYSSVPGAAACDICPVLTVSAAGATSCTSCPLPDVSNQPLTAVGFGFRGRSNICPANPTVGDHDEYSAAASYQSNFYFGLRSSATIVKVEPMTMTKTATLSLSVGEAPVTCMAVDATNGFLYAGVGANTLVKVNLNTFTRVSSLVLAASSTAGVSTCNVAGSVGYFTTGPYIVAVTLSSMTVSSTLLTTNSSGFGAASIDAVGGFGYFGANVALASGRMTITTVSLSSLAIVSVVDAADALPSYLPQYGNSLFFSATPGGDGAVYFYAQYGRANNFPYAPPYDPSNAFLLRFNTTSRTITATLSIGDARGWGVRGGIIGQTQATPEGEIFIAPGSTIGAVNVRSGVMSYRQVNEFIGLWQAYPLASGGTSAAIDSATGRVIMAATGGAQTTSPQSAWIEAGAAILLGTRVSDPETVSLPFEAATMGGVTVVDSSTNTSYGFSKGLWSQNWNCNQNNCWAYTTPASLIRISPTADGSSVVSDSVTTLAGNFWCRNTQGSPQCSSAASSSCNSYIDSSGCRMVAAIGACTIDTVRQVMWCGTAHGASGSSVYNFVFSINLRPASATIDQWTGSSAVTYYKVAAANSFTSASISADGNSLYFTDGGARVFKFNTQSMGSWNNPSVTQIATSLGNLYTSCTWNNTMYAASSSGNFVKIGLSTGTVTGSVPFAGASNVISCGVDPTGSAVLGVAPNSMQNSNVRTLAYVFDLKNGTQRPSFPIFSSNSPPLGDGSTPFNAAGYSGGSYPPPLQAVSPMFSPTDATVYFPADNGWYLGDVSTGVVMNQFASSMNLMEWLQISSSGTSSPLALPSLPGLYAAPSTGGKAFNSITILATKPCPLGQVRSGKFGNGACYPCKPGTIATLGSRNCYAVLPGYYSTPDRYSNNNVATGCAAGTYQPNYAQANASSCLSCGAGTWSAGSTGACTQCAAGSYSAAIGATSVSTCNLCPAGTYSPIRGATSIAQWLVRLMLSLVCCGHHVAPLPPFRPVSDSLRSPISCFHHGIDHHSFPTPLLRTYPPRSPSHAMQPDLRARIHQQRWCDLLLPVPARIQQDGPLRCNVSIRGGDSYVCYIRGSDCYVCWEYAVMMW